MCDTFNNDKTNVQILFTNSWLNIYNESQISMYRRRFEYMTRLTLITTSQRHSCAVGLKGDFGKTIMHANIYIILLRYLHRQNGIPNCQYLTNLDVGSTSAGMQIRVGKVDNIQYPSMLFEQDVSSGQPAWVV